MIDQKLGNRASALLVAVGEYDDPAYERLELAPKAAKKLSESLKNGGYRHDFPEVLNGGEKKDIIPSVDRWFREANENEVLFFFWTGHGRSEVEGHYLITKESPGKGLNGEVAFAAMTLGTMVANSPADKILVVLDTCYSGAGASDVANRLATMLATRVPKAGRSRAVAIIASAHPLKKSQEGQLCKELTKVLTDPRATSLWSDNDQNIWTPWLSKALKKSIGTELVHKADGDELDFVPNPRYHGALPTEDVETRQRRFSMAEVEEHLLPASRGIDIGSSGWYFTGRERLLTKLVKWLKDTERGMVVVTGPPGSGKSAVMGRVAILSDPYYRELAKREKALAEVAEEAIPPESTIDVAVYAKGKTLADSFGDITAALDITLSEGQRTDPVALIEAVKGLKKRVTILLDALDEAKPGHHFTIGERLLKPMSQLPKVRVLVGTRRSPDGATIPESEPRHARLRGLFGEDARILDLEDELNTDKDIAEYVRKRLMDSRHRDNPSGIGKISRAVARKATGIFLYARFVARTLEEVESLDEKLPEDALDAFVSDLTRRFGNQSEMVGEMLCALAWGEGKGLSRRVWAPVANALSRTGAHYTDDDVSWVLKHAGWHIIEFGEEGQAVYSLPHRLLADYYRNRFDEKDANFRITRVLSKGIAGEDWLNADPYLWRHLASHAAIAGLLDPMLTDPVYLAVADHTKLVPVLSKVRDLKAKDIANIYRRVVNQLYSVDYLERMAIIHLTAKQECPVLSDAVEPPVTTAWRCRWASWQPSVPHLALTDYEGKVTSAALGKVAGSPVVVSGSWDKTVRLWDAHSGRALGEPLTGHEDEVTSVALGEVAGSPVVVSGSDDKTVRLWDARSGRMLIEPLTDHESAVTSVALGEVDGSPVVVSGSLDYTVRLWDARSGRELGEPLTGHEGYVTSVALGEVDGSPVVVSGSHDKTVRLWDARTGGELGEPLTGHEGWVTSVALGEVDGLPVVVSGSYDKTVHLWDARTGRAWLEPLTGHEDEVTSVALGEVDGSPVVVSGSHDKTVRLWDARSGGELGEPLTGHEGWVTSVALGEVDGSSVVISGSSDKTVCLWYVRGGGALVEPQNSDKGNVTSVALGEVDGSAVVVSGSYDKTVHLWDARSGGELAEPLTGHEGYVTSVALGELDGSAVVVSGSHDKTVRLWDARTGGELGEPLTGHEDEVTSVALGEVDGSAVVVSGSYDKTVRLWHARSGRALLGPLTGHEGVVSSVALGEVDGSAVVVSGGNDGTVCLWDVRSGGALGEPLTGHEWWVTSVALGEVDGSPVVVSGSRDNTVRLWDARSGGALLEPLTGHKGYVTSVALGEVDGLQVVASGSYDRTMRLWDARTGRKSKMVLPIRSAVTGLAFAWQSTIVVGTVKGLLFLDIARISFQ